MTKKHITTLLAFLHLCIFASFVASCDDYLNEKPKGKNIPEMLSDFDEMLNYEYGVHRYDIMQAANLIGDRYVQAYYLTGAYPLYQANYLWDTSVNRTEWNNSDESAYYVGYGNIAVSNLVIENAPTATKATEAERQTLIAEAKALRAMAYYQIVNFYCNAYKPATAASEMGLPVIESTAVGAPYTQESLQYMYDYMLKDMEDALPSLPDHGKNALRPGKDAAYAFLARLYLTMMNYDRAEEYADKALALNNTLYDWTAFYAEHKAIIEKENDYTRAASPIGFDYPENYLFKHGSSVYSSSISSLPQWRSETVEDGDAKFYSSWKYRYYADDNQYWYGMLNGFFNYGGLKTVEQYLIKAECLARKGNLTEAMQLLNTVREKRIMPEKYQPATATSKAEAISLICRTKWNDLIGSIVPFADMRRLNAEGEYPYTLTRTRDGKQESLAPDSYLWTMVLPLGAIENAGGGHLERIATK